MSGLHWTAWQALVDERDAEIDRLRAELDAMVGKHHYQVAATTKLMRDLAAAEARLAAVIALCNEPRILWTSGVTYLMVDDVRAAALEGDHADS